jgi:ribose transport system substrate-binding protein
MHLTRLLVASLAAASLLAFSACKPSSDSMPVSGDAGGSAAAGKKLKLAFVSNGVASFWTICEAGVKAAGSDLGVEATMHMPAQGIGDQKRIIEDLLTRGVDGISVSPIDPENQTELLNQAAARVKLVTADSDAPKANRAVYIGMDNYSAGRLCGELVREALPNGGKLMIYIGRMEQDNARRRRQGTIDAILGRPANPANFDPPDAVLTGGGFTILGTMTDQFDRMVGLFAYNPPLMLEALDRAGKLGKVKVIAFDEADETLDGIQKGTVHGTVVQNPYQYGYESIKVLKALASGDTSVIPADKFLDIPARQIRKDNVDAFWADLKVKMGK